MTRLPTLLFLAALPLSLVSIAPASAQSTRPTTTVATLSLAQAERNAADLKQGMSAEDVQKLLGKPRRTALKNSGGSPTAPGQGRLQWSYTWTGAQSQGSLQVEFAAKSAEQWYVNSWEWASY
jgi:hypothetical protein